jgi:hypothetical protein
MKFNDELEQKVEEYFGCEITEEDHQILKILNNAINNSGILREGWLSEQEEERIKEWEARGCITIQPNGFTISRKMKDILDEMFPEQEN